jgi:hypothetical protein
MSDQVDERTDSQDERPLAMEAVFGLSELDYPEVLERAITHVKAHAAIGGLPPWICMGPRNIGGRILTLAQHPQHASILYAGSAHGGLWRTIDGGDTWDNIGGPDFSIPVGAIAISEHDPNTLYVGTGALRAFHVSGRGLWRVRAASPRGAATFEQIARAPGREVAPASVQDGRALRYTRIEIDPDDPNRFWAASQTGLWRGVYNPAAPLGNRVTWTLDFPPAADAPNGAPAREAGPVPQNGTSWPSYCTDLVVVRDSRDTEQYNRRARYLAIYVAIDGAGVFRGRYDRESNAVTWDRERLAIGFPADFSRVLISVCRRRPQHLHAVASVSNVPTAVFRSSDHGDHWEAGGTIPQSYLGGQQADYDLVLEVNPDNPDILLCGEIDLCLSTNAGRTFTPIIEWQNYNRGDRAQHADQHAAIFDVADRRRIWAGNDGGLSTAADIRRPPGARGYWRRRGHGITAPQFQDVATHPVLPQLTGGGLQDNASWVGFGGKTWYVVDSGDGGGMEMHAASAQVFTCSTQTGVSLTNVDTQANAVPWLTPRVIPDVPAAVDQTMFVRIIGYTTGGPSAFVPVVAQDPRVSGQVMFGWIAGSMPGVPLAYWADALGNTTAIAGVGGPGEECSAVAFGPPLPATSALTDGWIGTDAGNLFYSPSAPAGAFNSVPTPLPQPDGLIRRISDIAVHPRDPRIVAVSSVETQYWYCITIATAGARGVARFTVQRAKVLDLGGGATVTVLAPMPPPALPTVLTDAHVRIAGAPLIASFTAANYTPGDVWFISPLGRVVVGGANADPDLRIEAIVTTSSPVRIVITTPGARGTSQFSWQIGAGPVDGGHATAATVTVLGTHLVLGFSNANFAANDAWTVKPSGEVTPDAGNAGPGTLTAVARDSGRVHITYDRGQTWQDITHRDVVPAIVPAPPAPPTPPPPHERQHDLDALPPGPVACLKFDVSGADFRNLTLYAGTLVGVYRLESLPTPTQPLTLTGATPLVPAPANVNLGQTVQFTANLTLHGVGAQNHTTQVDWTSSNTAVASVNAQGHVQGLAAGNAAITATRGTISATHNIAVAAGPAGAAPGAPPAAPQPPVNIAWRPFNNRMPLALVTDLEGVAQGRILRAATFGRGVWDCDLDGAPTHRLFIRQLLTEDGREPRALVNVRITTPGALGVSQFTLAIEDIPTVLPAQPTAASVVIPGTHLTIQFSAANYNVNDRWTIAHTGAVIAHPGNTGAGAVTATITPRAIPALLAADPRLPPGVVGQDLTHAFDIRVDAAPFQFFDDRIDGVEFDEELSNRTPRRLERCAVYVQVHQAGTENVSSVQVRLFFSATSPAPQAAPPGAAIPADLLPAAQFYNATFTPEPVVIRITSAVPLPLGAAEFAWKMGGGAESAAQPTAATVVVPNTMTLHFAPGDYALDDSWTITPEGVVEPAPTNTSTGSVSYGPLWRRVGTVPPIQQVTPETPVVVRFDWVPPAGVSGNDIALLALVSGNGDALPAVLPPAHATISGLIQQERRAALRILPIDSLPVASLYIRDGIDDDARRGNVAFVARSPDIMVPHPDVANPAVDLRDLLDQRPQDHLVGNTPNRIYVRVHNAGPQATKGQVHLWAVALDDFNTPAFQTANWTHLATPDAGAVRPPLPVVVPAHGHALVHMDWPVPNHPPGQYKAYGLIALVRSDDGADALPDVARVTSLETFWKLFGEFFDSDNAALRVLRYRTS